jgi:hypothetical protein
MVVGKLSKFCISLKTYAAAGGEAEKCDEPNQKILSRACKTVIIGLGR